MNEPVRSESLDARAWWTLAVVVAVVLIAYLGLSAGLSSSHDDQRPPAGAKQEPAAESAEASASEEPSDVEDRDGAVGGAAGDAGSEPLDAQSLREFGELGVLPGLLDDFSNVPDCEFDDALSTCQ